jgi:Tfp pilus assembly protein PilN
MAVRINLLPYRKIRREQRQRQFNLMRPDRCAD